MFDCKGIIFPRHICKEIKKFNTNDKDSFKGQEKRKPTSLIDVESYLHCPFGVAD